MRLENLSLDRWVIHCFAHEVADPAWHWALGADTWAGSADLTVCHFTRLFEAPVSALSGYSDAQINQGLWCIVHNVCSDHMFALVDESVPSATRARCVRSIATLYSELFAIRCSNALSHCDHQVQEMSPLNSVCASCSGISCRWCLLQVCRHESELTMQCSKYSAERSNSLRSRVKRVPYTVSVTGLTTTQPRRGQPSIGSCRRLASTQPYACTLNAQRLATYCDDKPYARGGAQNGSRQRRRGMA